MANLRIPSSPLICFRFTASPQVKKGMYSIESKGLKQSLTRGIMSRRAARSRSQTASGFSGASSARAKGMLV
jgi:hypothetical protein